MYRLVRSRRKTLALVIERDGSLTVRAPLRTSQAEIERLVAAKAAWIEGKQAWVRQHAPPDAPPHAYLPGERFHFLGRLHPLRVVAGQAEALTLAEDGFRLAASRQPQAAVVFERWYRAQARRILAERAAALARRFGCQPSGLRITSARGRWGSCSSRGSLNFSWRLVLAPPAVIDYVVTHELAHLKVPNHSPAFWQQVAAWMPDYAVQRAWLKQNGAALMAA